MSFQIPRRDHFPRPLGDNSSHTPPDPEPGPMFKQPTLPDYVEARERWVETGDLTALWDMQDNVAAVPAGWGEPDLRPVVPVMTAPAAAPVSAHSYMRQVVLGFLVTFSVLWTIVFLLVIH